jgi:hypothetical protein
MIGILGAAYFKERKMRLYEWHLYMVYIKQNKSGVGAHAYNMDNMDPSLLTIFFARL